jgi:hypothetical protein
MPLVGPVTFGTKIDLFHQALSLWCDLLFTIGLILVDEVLKLTTGVGIAFKEAIYDLGLVLCMHMPSTPPLDGLGIRRSYIPRATKLSSGFFLFFHVPCFELLPTGLVIESTVWLMRCLIYDFDMGAILLGHGLVCLWHLRLRRAGRVVMVEDRGRNGLLIDDVQLVTFMDDVTSLICVDQDISLHLSTLCNRSPDYRWLVC